MSNQDQIKAFFNDAEGDWHPSSFDFIHSGEAVIDEVRALAPRFVLDAGCGYNLFKGRIPNLIGVDIANSHADLVCDILDAPFAPASFDVILALGSVNFGDESLIRKQLAKLSEWLTPGGRIFMRVNPGSLTSSIEYFPWSRNHIARFAEELGLEVEGEIVEDHNRKQAGQSAGMRYFFRYRRRA